MKIHSRLSESSAFIENFSDSDFKGKSVLLREEEAAANPDFATAVRLKQIWADMPGDPPHRRNLDPVALGPSILPGMILVERLDDGADYLWRVFGSEHALQYGVDLTGYRLSEIEESNRSAGAARCLFDTVVGTAAPVFMRLVYTSHKQVMRRAHGALLPLTGNDGTVGWICGHVEWG